MFRNRADEQAKQSKRQRSGGNAVLLRDKEPFLLAEKNLQQAGVRSKFLED